LVEDTLQRSFSTGGLQLGQSAICDDPPLIYDYYPVASALDHVQKVGAVEDRLPFGRQVLDQGLEHQLSAGVQAVQGVVEEDDSRVVDQAGSYHHFLPHAFRVGRQQLAIQGVSAELEEVRKLQDATLDHR